jgi:PKD repeat protein
MSDFVGYPLIGEANLLVQFTGISSGDPTSWEWDFGDGSPHSTQQSPIHVYTEAGNFSVSLTVIDGSTPETITKADYISVGMMADFTAQNNVGPADLTVQFTDISLGQPTSWDWDFGDGSPHSTEQNPTYQYTNPGTYTVTLIASNVETSDTEIKSYFVTVYTNADFVGEPRLGDSTLSVQFVDRSTGYPTSWYWNFGDGTYSIDQNPLHEYTEPGVYTVALTAVSGFNSDTEEKKNYIIISGTATPDIAPEPDISLYLKGDVEAFKSTTGIRVVFRNKSARG